jgi:hypothetical protein
MQISVLLGDICSLPLHQNRPDGDESVGVEFRKAPRGPSRAAAKCALLPLFLGGEAFLHSVEIVRA